MVLTTRSVSLVMSAPPEAVANKETALNMIALNQMVGLLEQMGQISNFATDIYTTLFSESQTTQERITDLSSRLTGVEAYIPTIREAFTNADPTYFFTTNPTETSYRTQPRLVDQLFAPEKRPVAITNIRTTTNPPPNLEMMDAIVGYSCLVKYSDPMLFYKVGTLQGDIAILSSPTHSV